MNVLLRGSVITVTGHRPKRLGYDAFDDMVALAYSSFERMKPRGIITGMALGWDMACAQAAVDLDLPFLAAVPFQGQDAIWPMSSRELYAELLAKAADVRIICEGPYAAYKLQLRNRWMADKCDEVLALWDGGESGTAGCVRHAQSLGKKVTNVWDEFVTMRQAA